MSEKNITLIATGGTIAGKSEEDGSYSAGSVPGQDLLRGLEPLPAPVQVKQLFQMDSREMSQEDWLILAGAVETALKRSRGVVIAHGTDTMEETAFFLSKTINAARPVILTGAMRPPGHFSPDGPFNLLQSLHLAAWPGARGVMLLMHDLFYDGAEAAKTAASRLNAFSSPGGELGQMYGLIPRTHRDWPSGQASFSLPEGTRLPLVGLLSGHVGMNTVMVREYIASGLRQGMRGLVYSAPGDGSVSLAMEATLLAAVKQGLRVVISSRTGCGWVGGRERGDASCLRGSGWDGPLQARINLMLELSQTESSF
ncbi:MAG: asparaginase [Desulfarculales bacterium]|jgi:L-asparaginase/Glu-tRNA(Gln) amidotransferase subunit D|nr:asparaginase [Desulfarculales bacterium]